MQYLSDVINFENIDRKKFNLIHSACGTGKSYMIANTFFEHFQNIKPNEVIYVTSRSLIVDQQTTLNNRNNLISKFNPRDLSVIRRWNNELDNDMIYYDGIQTMTYDKLIYIILFCNTIGLDTLNQVKAIIFDECHTMFADNFIKNMAALKVWIKDNISKGDKVFLGLTATPGILYHHQNSWGVEINNLTPIPLTRYKAQNLYSTDYKNLPGMLLCKAFPGKTIIMCYSITDCFELRDKIKNSAVLISPSNKRYIKKEMDPLRQYIIEHESLPETIPSSSGCERSQEEIPLEVLITTSTMREGINLNEKSGIKNVICCIPDEMHITQFVGRCRFDIENLIIAGEYIVNSIKTDKYLLRSRDAFYEYLENPERSEWFHSIKHLLRDDIQGITRIISYKELAYYNYIRENWLNKEIIKDRDEQELIDFTFKVNLFQDISSNRIGFNRIMQLISNSGQFKVITKRKIINKEKITVKIISELN